MNISVLIPYRSNGCPHRTVAFRNVLANVRKQLPDAEVVVEDASGEPFSRGASLNRAAVHVHHPLWLIQDADSLVAGSQLLAALGLAARGTPTLAYSEYVYQGEDGGVGWRLENAASHGALAIRGRDFWAAGGYDPRFRGWGYEDLALTSCLERLERVPGPLVHLWHPHDPSSAPGTATLAANERLYERYCRAPDREARLAIRREAP